VRTRSHNTRPQAVMDMDNAYGQFLFHHEQTCYAPTVHDFKRLGRQSMGWDRFGIRGHDIVSGLIQQVRIHVTPQVTIGDDAGQTPRATDNAYTSKPFVSHG
tara:strand:+ start:660 stop:965 length:306 start_codon:yes stop_codon:yes gene_type:complete